MRALGIVCEYNPFHFGHLYQMEESRKIAGDAAVVCVMSGDFVQRGEAALMDKFADRPPNTVTAFDGYGTEQIALLNNAKLIEDGPYIVYACGAHADDFVSAARKVWRK